MAYAITQKLFPVDIANLIVLFLYNPKKDQWAKYWRGESVKFVKRVFCYDCECSASEVLDFIKLRDYPLHTHVDKYYGIYKNIVLEINKLRRIDIEYKNTIKKLYSRIFINNNGNRFGRISVYSCY